MGAHNGLFIGIRNLSNDEWIFTIDGQENRIRKNGVAPIPFNFREIRVRLGEVNGEITR